MSNREGARKGEGKVISLVPDVCITPIGPAQSPVPYPVMASFDQSDSLSSNVCFGGEPAFLCGQSSISRVTGDTPGTGGGIKSGTVGGKAEPIKGSSTVRVNHKPVVRNGDPFMMNNGNTCGIVVYQPGAMPTCSIDSSGHPTADTNPPVKPWTPKQKGFLEKMGDSAKTEVWGTQSDARQTLEILKGEAKGAVNQVPETIEGLHRLDTWIDAKKLQGMASAERFLGQKELADGLDGFADKMMENANQFNLPKFTLDNPNQILGDKVITGAQLVVGGVELIAGGIAGLSKLLAKVGEKEALSGVELAAKKLEDIAMKTEKLEAAKKLEDAAMKEEANLAKSGQAAKTEAAADIKNPLHEPPKPAAEIEKSSADRLTVKNKKSLREKYLGRTPGKKSRTGKKVIERMREEGKVREQFGKTQFKASDEKWYPLEKADMSHKVDAVQWWNETGRDFGAKSSDVRQWMLDPDNYYLDHFSLNRSAGAKLGLNYLDPL